MKKWQQNIVLFDLDGTLTDSAEGIIRSVQHMQEKTGREVWEAEKLGFIVGPPLRDSFRDAFGMKTEEEIDNAVAVFRERYFSVGLFENAVYPGVKEMLEELKKMGKRLAVATSKHESTAVRILTHFGLADYFEVIGGDAPEANRDNKTKVVAYVLERMNAEKSDVAMVGDRKYDIEGAHALGVEAIGVLYGYGSKEEFAACGADAVVETPAELVELFR